MSRQRISLEIIFDFFKELFPQAYVCKMSQLGLASPNDRAIGIVVQPGPHGAIEKLRALTTHPASIANWWGHTALYVRQDGRITRAIGFDPHRLKMALPSSWSVAQGTSVTEGYYFDEDKMFNSPDVLCVEFPASLNLVKKILKKLPEPGRGTPRQLLQTYATHDGSRLIAAGAHYDPSDMGNCINLINTVLGKAGIRMINTQTGTAFDSAQWKLTRAIQHRQVEFRYPKKGALRVVQPTYLRMPRVLQIARRTGGALRTVALATTVWKIVQTMVAAVGLAEAPDWVWSDTAFFVVWLLDILQETIPATSWFWSLQPAAFDTILTTGVTLAWLYQIVSGPSAWMGFLLAYALMIGVAFQLS